MQSDQMIQSRNYVEKENDHLDIISINLWTIA